MLEPEGVDQVRGEEGPTQWMEHDRLGERAGVLEVGELASVAEGAEEGALAQDDPVLVGVGVEVRGRARQHREERRLGPAEVAGGDAEVGVGGGLGAGEAVPVGQTVEVREQDLVLAQDLLEVLGPRDFEQFIAEAALARLTAGVEQLDELLGDRAGAGDEAAVAEALGQRAGDGVGVEAVVIEELAVLADEGGNPQARAELVELAGLTAQAEVGGQLAEQAAVAVEDAVALVPRVGERGPGLADAGADERPEGGGGGDDRKCPEGQAEEPAAAARVHRKEYAERRARHCRPARVRA